MHGRSLGITAMQALRFVYLINGRAGVDATLMRALCLTHPDCEEFVLLESTPQVATFRARRRGHEAVTLSWTLEDARRARLSDRDTWRAYPAQMLRARVTAELARLVFPDAVAGLVMSEAAEETPSERASAEEVPDVPSGTSAADASAPALAARTEDSVDSDNVDYPVPARRLGGARREPKLVGDIWQEMEEAYDAMRDGHYEEPVENTP
jgi:hypothetical protein